MGTGNSREELLALPLRERLLRYFNDRVTRSLAICLAFLAVQEKERGE